MKGRLFPAKPDDDFGTGDDGGGGEFEEDSYDEDSDPG
jgi:hypothetical protein